MASAENLLNLLNNFNEESYAVLANKGLLRRAKKEIDKGTQIQASLKSDDLAEIQVQEFVVTIDKKGPSQATCTCPAAGCCQHILIACLLLPDALGGTEQTEPSEAVETTQALPTEEEVKKWAGAETFRKALNLALNNVVSIEKNCVTFTGEIESRILPSGMDSAITNAQPKQKKTYITAGALALLKEQGAELVLVSQEQQKDLDLSLLENLKDLLVEAVELGLNHLSKSIQMRLSSLSVQCRVGGLVRPSLEVESCAEEVRLLIARHSTADQIRLFNKLSSLYALCESILQQGVNADKAYVGQARSTYSSQGRLNLVGMGAYPWETESGFIGLTTLYWAPEEKCFFSWADSRPKHSTAGFSPTLRYEQESPWKGGGSLKTLINSTFTLENVKGNEQRRLSAQEQTRVSEVIPNKTEHIPEPVTDWKAFTRNSSSGLQRGVPLDGLFLLEPQKWENTFFDEVNQELIIPVHDTNGETIPVILPFTELTASGVFFLEGLKNLKDYRLLAFHRRHPQPHFFPVSLIHKKTAAQIDILLQPRKKGLKLGKRLLQKLKVFVPLPEDSQAATRTLDEQSPFSLLLAPYQTHLEQCAETGRIKQLNEELPLLQNLGLTNLHNQFGTLYNGNSLLILRYLMNLLDSNNH